MLKPRRNCNTHHRLGENSAGASARATNPDGSPMSEKDARYWADLALPDEEKNARYLATLLPRPLPLTRRER